MENLPKCYRENAVLLKRNDFVNLEAMSDGVKSSLRFTRIPDFYTIDDKEYYAAEIKMEGLKVGTAAIAGENVLNVKLCASDRSLHVKNVNFCVPTEADIQRVSVEVHNDTIFIKTPMKNEGLQVQRDPED